MAAIEKSFVLIGILAVLVFTSSMLKAQEVIHSFDRDDGNGSAPSGKMVFVNGYLYGAAEMGGEYNGGVIFKIKPDGSGYEIIHHFREATGSHPGFYGLITDGNWLYGEANKGGQYNSGVVFKVRLDGSEYTVIHDMGMGTEPRSVSIIQYLLGDKLFGLDTHSGSNGEGQFFSVNINTGAFTTLHDFDFGSGSSNYFHAALTYDGQRFYSISERGGAKSAGTIFSILPDGTGYTQIYSFDPAKEDGCEPGGAGLLLMGDYLYGLTPAARDSDYHSQLPYGDSANGVIFRIKKDGSDYKALHKLALLPGLLQCGQFDEGLTFANGKMFGFVSGGGSYNRGAAFSLGENGEKFTILAEFNIKTGGPSYAAPLLIGNYLYGISSFGGNKSSGSVFRVAIEPSDSRINVSIVPQAAVKQGAMWSFAYQNSWRKAGTTGIEAGNYSIIFKEVEGWQKPDDIAVKIKNGETVNVQGEYISDVPQGFGFVHVIIKGLSARKDGALWMVVGSGKWHKSGERIQVPVGKVKIRFKKLEGYKKPGRMVLQIAGGLTEQIIQPYEKN